MPTTATINSAIIDAVNNQVIVQFTMISTANPDSPAQGTNPFPLGTTIQEIDTYIQTQVNTVEESYNTQAQIDYQGLVGSTINSNV